MSEPFTEARVQEALLEDSKLLERASQLIAQTAASALEAEALLKGARMLIGILADENARLAQENARLRLRQGFGGMQ